MRRWVSRGQNTTYFGAGVEQMGHRRLQLKEREHGVVRAPSRFCLYVPGEGPMQEPWFTPFVSKSLNIKINNQRKESIF
jgi:hypothetical protein